MLKSENEIYASIFINVFDIVDYNHLKKYTATQKYAWKNLKTKDLLTPHVELYLQNLYFLEGRLNLNCFKNTWYFW